jgi:hypothetical protein
MSEELGPIPIESPEVIIDSELTEGLAGEKIRVTLEGVAELEALGVTAAAAMLEVEVGVIVGKLGILEDEDIMVALIDADEAEEAVIDILEAEAVVETRTEVDEAEAEVEVIEVGEDMLVMVEADDMDMDELETSSMAI